jgi:hypothetical protein
MLFRGLSVPLWAAWCQHVVWLALIKHFFDCGWLKAFVIAVIAVVIFVIIVALPAVIGIGIIALGF